MISSLGLEIRAIIEQSPYQEGDLSLDPINIEELYFKYMFYIYCVFGQFINIFLHMALVPVVKCADRVLTRPRNEYVAT